MPKARPRRLPPQRGWRPKGRRPPRAVEQPAAPQPAAPVAVAEAQPNVVVLPKTMAVGDLARTLEVSVVDVIRGLVNMGVMASINQTIDFETASLVANELGFETKPEEEVAAPVTEEMGPASRPGKETPGATEAR